MCNGRRAGALPYHSMYLGFNQAGCDRIYPNPLRSDLTCKAYGEARAAASLLRKFTATA